MSDLMLYDGDIKSTIFGDINIVNYGDDIIQSAVNNINCIYGEYKLHPTLGNVLHRRRNKITRTNLQTIMSDCRNAIMNDRRIDFIVSMEAAINPDNNSAVDIAFVIQDTARNQYSSNITVIIEVSE